MGEVPSGLNIKCNDDEKLGRHRVLGSHTSTVEPNAYIEGAEVVMEMGWKEGPHDREPCLPQKVSSEGGKEGGRKCHCILRTVCVNYTESVLFVIVSH